MLTRREFVASALAASVIGPPPLRLPEPPRMRRPQRIPIDGTTDGNGNATIPINLPRGTGAWFDLKFVLGTTGPAEWEIRISGQSVNYGRGRRVTLGPELIMDGETLSILVLGGPLNAPITGMASGRSGDPAWILDGFSPAPNTIALDNPNTRINPFAYVTAAANAGAQKISLATVSHLAPGDQLHIFFNVVAGPMQGAGGFRVTGVDYVNNTVNLQSGLLFNLFVGDVVTLIAEAFDEVTTLSGQQPVTMQNATPALWQAAQTSVDATLSLAAGASATYVAGVGGQKVYLHELAGGFDVAEVGSDFALFDGATTGTPIGRLSMATINPQAQDWKGRPLTTGNPFSVKSEATAVHAFRGTLSYSQG